MSGSNRHSGILRNTTVVKPSREELQKQRFDAAAHAVLVGHEIIQGMARQRGYEQDRQQDQSRDQSRGQSQRR